MSDRAEIRTERLVLRPLASGDAEAIARGAGDWEVVRWLAVVPFPYGETDARAFLASSEALPGRAWAICDAEGLRGIVSIGEELGYWLAREAWGRGYGTEAVRAAMEAGFDDPSRERIEASYMLGNVRSARVLERVGFRDVSEEERMFRALGRVAAIRRMEITRPEWERLRQGAGWSIAGQKEGTA